MKGRGNVQAGVRVAPGIWGHDDRAGGGLFCRLVNASCRTGFSVQKTASGDLGFQKEEGFR